jgi:hypothetical protein
MDISRSTSRSRIRLIYLATGSHPVLYSSLTEDQRLFGEIKAKITTDRAGLRWQNNIQLAPKDTECDVVNWS